jgi:hypothetical protein
MEPALKEAIAIVEAVLLGEISTRSELNERIGRLNVRVKDDIDDALHQAGHYVDDADIRQRDLEYAEAQKAELELTLQRLRLATC